MIVVLMDNRYHKTMVIPEWVLATSIIAPVEIAEWGFPTRYHDAVFIHVEGNMLYGDPIYYQVKGPGLPAQWWER